MRNEQSGTVSGARKRRNDFATQKEYHK